ncbi:NUDIX hydrolase N-terminal domain-containing protein [Haladaptatus halobius]|uniref:NUDIX hydrolase N-terminal domain-containing protein n=1 Tax=Haladaptatus halobius TaxID=2884875 RepID=UPI001D0A48C4|nr:NUDIX hydrolase N-terminal domain-containing protein [Haladaptatus halobius]
MNTDDDFLALLDELRIVAQVGLEHADDPYDEERYERILTLVSEWYGQSVDLPPEDVRARFAGEVGYVTPKVSADAAVFNADGRVLLQLRADDETWCLPGGFSDPNESPDETVVRETREETGLAVEPNDFVGVYTRKPGEYGPHCLVRHVYLCTVTGGEIETSREGTDVRYRAIEDVPVWHKDHEAIARDARDHWHSSG